METNTMLTHRPMTVDDKQRADRFLTEHGAVWQSVSLDHLNMNLMFFDAETLIGIASLKPFNLESRPVASICWYTFERAYLDTDVLTYFVSAATDYLLSAGATQIFIDCAGHNFKLERALRRQGFVPMSNRAFARKYGERQNLRVMLFTTGLFAFGSQSYSFPAERPPKKPYFHLPVTILGNLLALLIFTTFIDERATFVDVAYVTLMMSSVLAVRYFTVFLTAVFYRKRVVFKMWGPGLVYMLFFSAIQWLYVPALGSFNLLEDGKTVEEDETIVRNMTLNGMVSMLAVAWLGHLVHQLQLLTVNSPFFWD
ncbi:MAG: hypothetical protein EA374_01235, partial [Acholeplasmatales bacterium]